MDETPRVGWRSCLWLVVLLVVGPLLLGTCLGLLTLAWRALT